MTILVAGQDPAGAVAVAARLGGDAAAVGADGALTPLGEYRDPHDVAVYVLDACVPADAVDLAALGRLRAGLSTVLVATGAEVYPDAAETTAASARRLGADVLAVQPDSGAGFDALHEALVHPAPPAPRPPRMGAAPSNPALERADRSAYLRAAVARLRATLLAASAEGFRLRQDVDERLDDDGDVRARLDGVVVELERSLREQLRAVYRGTFAGWPAVPEPAAPSLPRADPPAAPARRRGPEDAAVLVLGASAGLGIGRAVAAPLEALGGVRWLALPISLAVGLAAAVWLLRVRRRTAARAERRNRADAASAVFRQRVEVELAAALVAAEADAALRIARGPATDPGGGRGSGTDPGAGASNSYGP
ncbi:hypothetical protein [Tsukamurella pseudospumae]|uniref:Uncharacterized protein n=1 Tax=Tsukamurella pseudospumae TaxID=239498 RepID=A0A137ZYE4_9ACTN|nr:hypothetical protein [Tsukamurella pseudospumae]KXP03216.1 hypothetical protein AXK60_15285 [Tsukamurella pseudospumae]